MILFDSITQSQVEAYVLNGKEYRNSRVYDAKRPLNEFYDHLFLKQITGPDVYVAPKHSERYTVVRGSASERSKLYDSNYLIAKLIIGDLN